ncbi:unnamed protein product, partial [Mesorhabditis spiculigera]
MRAQTVFLVVAGSLTLVQASLHDRLRSKRGFLQFGPGPALGTTLAPVNGGGPGPANPTKASHFGPGDNGQSISFDDADISDSQLGGLITDVPLFQVPSGNGALALPPVNQQGPGPALGTTLEPLEHPNIGGAYTTTLEPVRFGGSGGGIPTTAGHFVGPVGGFHPRRGRGAGGPGPALDTTLAPVQFGGPGPALGTTAPQQKVGPVGK